MTSGHQKWRGKSTLFHATFERGTKLTVPASAIYVAWPQFGHAREVMQSMKTYKKLKLKG